MGLVRALETFVKKKTYYFSVPQILNGSLCLLWYETHIRTQLIAARFYNKLYRQVYYTEYMLVFIL